MNLENLTQKITNELIEKVRTDFEDNLKSLFKKCDSPIEKVFLAFLIDKIVNNVDFISDKFEFTTTHIEPRISSCQNIFIIQGIKFTSKTSVNSKTLEGKCYSDGKDCFGFRELLIYPQYVIHSDEKQIYKFIDIAIFSQRNYEDSKEIIIDKKIAIECDGHEFHATREQIRRDNIRQRFIASNGFTVLRYSGSEIYEECKSNMENVFEELINILEIEELPDVFKGNWLKDII